MRCKYQRRLYTAKKALHRGHFISRNGKGGRKGLGTSATRAAIIEKIIKSGFVKRENKNLIATDLGKNLIKVLPEKLKSPLLTAEWEQKLKCVELGTIFASDFMTKIASFIHQIIKENSEPNPEFVNLFPRAENRVVLGNCPRCGSPVYEGKIGYFCNKSDCGFKLWKESKFWTTKRKPLTAEIVARLLKDGKVALKDLFSEKAGKLYRATVFLDDTGEKFVNFKMEFNKK